MEQKSNGVKSDGAISLYIKIEKRKKKKEELCRELCIEQNSNGEKSDGTTKRRIDRWTERRNEERRSDESVY